MSGKRPACEVGVELSGEFGLAAALVGQREKIDHDAAGLPLRQALPGATSKVRR